MSEQITEIIGLTGTIVESSNKNLLGITGKIIDETKNILLMNTKSGEKLIPKYSSKFKVYKNNIVFFVNGSQLLKRSHERLEVFS